MKDLVTRLVTLMIADKQCREIIHDIGFGKGYAKALSDVDSLIIRNKSIPLSDRGYVVTKLEELKKKRGGYAK